MAAKGKRARKSSLNLMAYLAFMNANKDEIEKKYLEESVREKAGEMWKKLDAKKRAEWKDKAENDKKEVTKGKKRPAEKAQAKENPAKKTKESPKKTKEENGDGKDSPSERACIILQVSPRTLGGENLVLGG